MNDLTHEELRKAWDAADAGRKAAEQKLAAANALLERARSEWVSNIDEFDDPVTQELARDICTYLESHLAGQPAAPVGRLEREMAKIGVRSRLGKSSAPSLDAKTCAECHVTTLFGAPGFNHAPTCSEVLGQTAAPTNPVCAFCGNGHEVCSCL